MVVHADVVGQHLTSPAIVIPGDHDHRDTCLAKLGERGEHAEARSRNDGLPFEPELEQVPVDDYRGSRRP